MKKNYSPKCVGGDWCINMLTGRTDMLELDFIFKKIIWLCLFLETSVLYHTWKTEEPALYEYV